MSRKHHARFPESCPKENPLIVWLLSEESERAAAEAMGTDIIETTGAPKP